LLIIDIITDTKLLILSYGVKERWANFVTDSSTDLFSTSSSDVQGTIFNLISRMKQGKYMQKTNHYVLYYFFVVDIINSIMTLQFYSTTTLDQHSMWS